MSSEEIGWGYKASPQLRLAALQRELESVLLVAGRIQDEIAVLELEIGLNEPSKGL